MWWLMRCEFGISIFKLIQFLDHGYIVGPYMFGGDFMMVKNCDRGEISSHV